MSNVIKTYNIRYEEKAKKIDSNERADQLIKEYIKKNGIMPLGAEDNIQNEVDSILAGMQNPEPNIDPENTLENEEDGFIPGIKAALYDENNSETESELSESIVSDDFSGSNNTADTSDSRQILDDEILIKNDEYLRHQAEMKQKIEEESAKILEDAKTEVKRLMAQAVIDAEDEKNRLFEEARKDGYNAGFNDGLFEIDKLKKELEEKDKARTAEYERQVQNMEPAFVDILISLVQKLTGIEAEDNKEIIFHLIHQAILGQAASNSYIIRVSKSDYDYVLAKKDSLQGFMKKGAVVEILEDHLLSKNQCLIETDSRIIDCSLDVQLKNLITDLKMLN